MKKENFRSAKLVAQPNRVVAIFLAFVFAITSIVVGVNYAMKARGENFDMKGNVEIGGMTLNKGVRTNKDGTYDIRLEATATSNYVSKSLGENTPLDVVVVKDTGSEMNTQDVLSQYSPVDTDTFSVSGALGLYVKDGTDYYPIETEEFYKEAPADLSTYPGTPKTSWTAQSANGWYYAEDKRDLYYRVSDGVFDKVYTTNSTQYTITTNNISVNSDVAHNNGTYYGSTKYYVYTHQNESTGADETSGWHRVWYKSTRTGYTTYTYKYTFYYFKNSVEGNDGTQSITSGKAGDDNGTIVLLSDYQKGSIDIGAVTGRTSNQTDVQNSTANGTDGYLYTTTGNSSTLNYMATDDTSTVLACQDPSSESGDSHVYNGVLYTKAYRLSYTGKSGKQIIGNEVWNTSDTAYTGTLYTADKITRKKAQDQAVEVFTNQLTANGIDYHYEEVSYSDNNLGTGLTAAKNWFTDHNCSEDRKKVVVLFSDDEATNDASDVAQTLKNDGVSIYTVGLYPNGVNSTVNGYLKAASSETYDGQGADGTYNYSATDKPTLDTQSELIANALKNPVTVVKPDSSMVLRDIVSSNFVIPDKPRVDVKVGNNGTETTASGVTATWGADEKTLDVTGFDYSSNVGKTLIVEILGLEKVYAVTPSDDGSGTQVVYTNDPASGVYYNSGNSLFAAFPMPSVPYDASGDTTSDLHSTNVAIREEFATLTDMISTINGTAEFKAQLIAIDDVEDQAEWDADADVYDKDVTLPAVTLSNQSADYDDTDGIADSREWSTGKLFPDGNVYTETPSSDGSETFTFPHPGVYLYKVTQSAINLGTPSPDITEYYMKVFVRNGDKKNGELSSGLYIENITVRKGNSDESTAKVNYTTDGSAANDFVFANEYFPESTGSLTFTKVLEASEEANPIVDTDKAQAFEFELVISLPDIIHDRAGFRLPTVTTEDGFTEIAASNETLIDGKLRLKAGESITLTDLPMNAKYTFTENGIPVDTIIETDGQQATITEVKPIPTSEEDATSAGLKYFCEDGTTKTGVLTEATGGATITNKKISYVPLEPEGITNTVPLWVAGIVIAVFFAVAGGFFLRSKLKEDDLTQ